MCAVHDVGSATEHRGDNEAASDDGNDGSGDVDDRDVDGDHHHRHHHHHDNHQIMAMHEH